MSSELQLRGWRRMLLPDAAQRDAWSWTRPQLDPRMFYRRATQMRNLYSFGTLLRNSVIVNNIAMALNKDFDVQNIIKSVKLPKTSKFQQAIERIFKRSQYTKIVQS
ncbi:unnamed protein product [Plutella xylostella]|uniref:(diamondback moth) hypothetical protein n=1 Tax=Plutella xylostella TaxID=51655 RepID=A0A8S4DRF8_PLUXY|nr:unnamed protein product [Plutella xylostella]